MDKAEVPGELVQLPEFDDPRVQIAYRILCDTDQPPPGEHWEGFAARHIVAALSPDPASPDALKALEDWLTSSAFNSVGLIMRYESSYKVELDHDQQAYLGSGTALAAAILAALEASK